MKALRWMEVGSRIWTSYWLLICGSFLVVGSVVLTWLRFPYSFNVAGFELPVQALVPHIHEFSYGLIGIAVLAIALYYRKRFQWALLLGAAILLADWMLNSRSIMAPSGPMVTPWPQIAAQSWVVTPKPALTIICLGGLLEGDE